MSNKIITYRIEGPSGSITGMVLSDLMQTVFGDNPDEMFGDLSKDEFYEYKIIIEKRFTVKQLMNMDDSDGDIH